MMRPRPVVPLAEAGPECGRKAHALAVLLRAGLPVPDGFVVTDPATDPELIAAHLRRLRAPAVAVRSSGITEDSANASFAGQLETVLGARSRDGVMAAVARCAASANTDRVRGYRTHLHLDGDADTPVIACCAASGHADHLRVDRTHPHLDGDASTPVIVQELVEADRSGVLFTRDPRTGAATIVINASWGLGESIVSGAVVPDEITVTPPADTVHVTVGSKETRLDLSDDGVTRSPVPEPDRTRGCLTPDEVARLVALARRCEEHLGAPQDVEWAVRGDEIWLLQSRPVTTRAAPGTAATPRGPVLVTGVPCSPGRAAGPVRVVRCVDDFATVRRGDVLVCRTTDPAWTPLFRLVAGVVTETGGILCHAAIVAREYGIPAVVGATGAMATLVPEEPVTVDGTLGTVSG